MVRVQHVEWSNNSIPCGHSAIHASDFEGLDLELHCWSDSGDRGTETKPNEQVGREFPRRRELAFPLGEERGIAQVGNSPLVHTRTAFPGVGVEFDVDATGVVVRIRVESQETAIRPIVHWVDGPVPTQTLHVLAPSRFVGHGSSPVH